jgi:hypothetical protein
MITQFLELDVSDTGFSLRVLSYSVLDRCDGSISRTFRGIYLAFEVVQSSSGPKTKAYKITFENVSRFVFFEH